MPQTQGTAESAQESEARKNQALTPGGFPLPERDVRSKRLPWLSFLLRMDTMRQAARVLSLLALDFIVLVGTGEHIEDVASALRDGTDSSINVIGFVSITPRPDNGIVSLGTLEHLPEVLETHRVDEVVIADPDFPQQQAVELVDQCHQR